MGSSPRCLIPLQINACILHMAWTVLPKCRPWWTKGFPGRLNHNNLVKSNIIQNCQHTGFSSLPAWERRPGHCWGASSRQPSKRRGRRLTWERSLSWHFKWSPLESEHDKWVTRKESKRILKGKVLTYMVSYFRTSSVSHDIYMWYVALLIYSRYTLYTLSCFLLSFLTLRVCFSFSLLLSILH